MSKGTKIFIIVLLALLVLCVCCCASTFLAFTYGGVQFFENFGTTIDDPQAAQEIGDAMFEYTLPPGYTEQTAMDMGFIKMLMITPTSNANQIIMLMQLPGMMTVDPSVYQEQMQQQMQSQFGGQSTMELVETDSMTIRGQQVDLMYFEGTSSEYGYPMRMMVSSFIKGDNGQIMVMIMGDASGWDQMMVDNFLQSIR